MWYHLVDTRPPQERTRALLASVDSQEAGDFQRSVRDVGKAHRRVCNLEERSRGGDGGDASDMRVAGEF